MQVNSERVIAHLGNRIRLLEIENAVLMAQIDGFVKENSINYEETPSQTDESVV